MSAAAMPLQSRLPETMALMSIDAPNVRAAARLANLLRPHDCDLFTGDAPRWRVQVLELSDVDPIRATIQSWLVSEDLQETTVLIDGERQITVAREL